MWDPLSASFELLEGSKDEKLLPIKAVIRCTQFLAHLHVAHTTKFDKLVELIVSCGGETTNLP